MRETKAEILSEIEGEYLKAKKVANNTYKVEYKDGRIAIRFHHTDVVTWMPNGDVILNSGEYQTHTTKERINSFSNFQIMQHNWNWYVFNGYPNSWNPKAPNFNGVTFYDGITFKANGKLKSEDKSINYKKQNSLKRKITKYVKLIDDLESIPLPSGGDCWYCHLSNDEGNLDDLAHDKSHLINHLNEGYLHGSILWNAMKEYGYRDDQIYFQIQLKFKDTFKRALRKYLIKRLVLNA